MNQLCLTWVSVCDEPMEAEQTDLAVCCAASHPDTYAELHDGMLSFGNLGGKDVEVGA